MSSSRRRTRRRRLTLTGALTLLVVLVAGWLATSDSQLVGELRDAAARAPDEVAGAVGDAADDPTAASGGGGASLGGLDPALTADEARQVLAALQDAPPSLPDMPRYDRDDYGQRWADTEGNGCNQRDDVLLRDARAGTVEVAQQGQCDHDVLAGTWDGPYTGFELTFDDLKDGAQAQAISIDHIVPIAEAHRSGAGAFPAERKELYATDLDNLVATDGPTNSEKADDDPGQWRPPLQTSWCGYAVAWVAVKDEWSLTVDAEERAALEEMLGTC